MEHREAGGRQQGDGQRLPGPVCWRRTRGERDTEAVWPLARGVDVQLALENVVDDRLGQVIHDMAVPVLQGQPG